MLCTQSDTFDVPVALATILQIREINSYQRTLFFQNISTSTLAIQIEESADGGTTWELIDTAFNLGTVGSGSDIAIKNIDSGNILRVRASGGGNDRDVSISFARMYLSENNIWTSSVV